MKGRTVKKNKQEASSFGVIHLIFGCIIVITVVLWIFYHSTDFSKENSVNLRSKFHLTLRNNSSGDLEKWMHSSLSQATEKLEKYRSMTKLSRNDSILPINPPTNTRPVSPMKLLLNASSSSKPSVSFVNANIAKLHAVTYASHRGKDDRFCRAIESAVRNSIPLVILGWGVKWRGLSQKLEAAYEYSKSLPAEDILLFTDAFDILYTNSIDSIYQSFMTLNASLVFSAECGCWPHILEPGRPCFTRYPSSPTPYRYLNSGTWIGYAKPASEMLLVVMKEAGSSFGNANDQKLIADLFLDGRFGIKLDYYNKIFQSMHMTLDPPLPYCNPGEDVKFNSDKKWFNQRTKSYPAVFHFNGGGKTHHLSMEHKAWYKSPLENTPDKITALLNSRIEVPTNPQGHMTFGDLCSDYVHKEYHH